MVGTVQMRALTRIAAQTDVARLALIGDRRQLRSVEAGQPFGLLQDAGMPTARMDEVVRQRDADLRQAVLHMVADEPRMALEELGNGVLETESDELGRKAAHLWLDLDPNLRDGTAILAPTHELRAEINEAVRQGLEDEGVLRGPALEIEGYVNLHLTRSQKGAVANYRPGDVAVFHHDVYGVKAKAGDACRRRWRRRTTGACCWRIPTAGSGGSTRRATSATGSTSTRPGRWSSGPATACAGPVTTPRAA